ncbi:hypothetical protein [Glycomyces tenuis]|uniref:aromatic-ring hydroxylase C-terminal domain-containing protein n=1 Tax=Glycomyces tenuis TaxID=58116 RepID=UPI003CCBD01B
MVEKGGGARRPGDRVPDLACALPDGGPTRLHAELGRRWALLVPSSGGGAHLAEARKRLGEVVALTPEDGERRDIWLVRPDAHLAWRGGPEAAPRLGRWLEGALRHGTARP